MALNFPGPYEVRIFYTAGGRAHVHRLNVAFQTLGSIGGPFIDFYPLGRDGTYTETLKARVDAWIAAIKTQFNSGSTFTHAELWEYEPLSFESSFVTTYTLAVAGTSGTGTNQASESIYVFRTQEGGIMKLSLLDTVIASGAGLAYTGLTAAQQGIVDLVLASSNVWKARDTSYPFAFIKLYPGVNEALFKKIYR